MQKYYNIIANKSQADARQIFFRKEGKQPSD